MTRSQVSYKKRVEGKSSEGVQREDNGLCLMAAMNLELPKQDFTSSSHHHVEDGARGPEAVF